MIPNIARGKSVLTMAYQASNGESRPCMLGEPLLTTAKSLEGVDFDEVPVIDVSGIHNGDLEERLMVARQIRDACIKVGFFYVKGHGIPKDVTDKAFEASKSFFQLPYEDKMDIHIEKSPSFKGYEDPLYGRIDPGTKSGKFQLPLLDRSEGVWRY